MMQGYTTLAGYRYERKYTAGEHHRGQIQVLVRQNPASFRKAYPSRRINNIYFDTPGLDCYFDNLFGVGNRWKIRIRWYGELKQIIQQPVLEIKLRKGYLIGKKSWALNPIDFSGKVSETGLMESIACSELPEDLRSRILGMKPVMVNSYFREYYVSGDGKIRLTLDDRLEYRDFRLYANHSNQVFRESHKLVVEMKYGQEEDEFARGISNLFPVRLDKNSKFVSGMRFIRPGIAD